MEAKRSFATACCALLALLCFQHTAAHPIDSLSPARELAGMEELLKRLEEKVSLMEDLQDNAEAEADVEELEGQRERQTEFADDREDQQPEPRVNFAPFAASDRRALLKRMRGLQAPKSLRESGCFGSRLDRIGAVSGMGCKGLRRI